MFTYVHFIIAFLKQIFICQRLFSFELERFFIIQINQVLLYCLH
jgi:hypothetical protein